MVSRGCWVSKSHLQCVCLPSRLMMPSPRLRRALLSCQQSACLPEQSRWQPRSAAPSAAWMAVCHESLLWYATTVATAGRLALDKGFRLASCLAPLQRPSPARVGVAKDALASRRLEDGKDQHAFGGGGRIRHLALGWHSGLSRCATARTDLHEQHSYSLEESAVDRQWERTMAHAVTSRGDEMVVLV